MKLLFDQNLSPSLVARLADVFPASTHTEHSGLGTTADNEVWEYARTYGFVIVSKDADFADITAMRGAPPQVIWVRLGNCTTTQIEDLLRRHLETIERMASDGTVGILELS